MDLSAWHGFQEVVTARTHAVEEVAFEFLLEPDAWVAFMWNRDQPAYFGIRFSVNPLFDTTRFKASDIDAFLESTTIEASLASNSWHRVRILFADNEVIAYLDGREITRFPGMRQDTRQIAFRAGLNRALIDNVSISNAGEMTFVDTFDNQSDFVRPVIYAMTTVLLVNIAVFLATRAFSRNLHQAGLHYLLLNFVLLSTTGLLYGYRYFGGSLYPTINHFLTQEETRWKTAEATQINNVIQERYANLKRPDEHRILFIGTSQTWGAGAKNPEDTFANEFQDRLNLQGNSRFTVINGGISALTSTQLLDLYRTQWLDLDLDTVVINLSNNDSTGMEFEDNLMEMVLLGNTRDIRTVLVLEPNTIENNDTRSHQKLLDNHESMRRVAAANDLLLIDMPARLNDHYDDGFLWWDKVHLSSFGQSLFADVLMDELAPVLTEGDK
jgi:lysophospholipase L1-like esterase